MTLLWPLSHPQMLHDPMCTSQLNTPALISPCLPLSVISHKTTESGRRSRLSVPVVYEAPCVFMCVCMSRNPGRVVPSTEKLPRVSLPAPPVRAVDLPSTCHGGGAHDGDLGLAGVQVGGDVVHDDVHGLYQAQHHSVVLKTRRQEGDWRRTSLSNRTGRTSLSNRSKGRRTPRVCRVIAGRALSSQGQVRRSRERASYPISQTRGDC